MAAGNFEVYISGRAYKAPGDHMTYEDVVKAWDELYRTDDTYLIGNPGIDYQDDAKGERGVMFPGDKVWIKDGTSFSVDPEHVS
ncbi:MAG: hypothetical protein OXR67_02125 [Chloroflexota bacterium]|nr:hypothetical protein [Chloroflexota bacterium]